jgi:hypothetical protein
MSDLDKYLSEVADYAEEQLTSKLNKEIGTLISNGQQPHLWRILKSIPGAMLTITFLKEEA